MDNPYISVTMTCYNYGKYMLRGLEAIKRQNFTDYEVVMVDDCSSDNTVEIVEKFIIDNPQMKIKFIKNEKNLGVLEARNVILNNACGKYIMLCDSDDWMEDDCLEILAKATENGLVDRVIAEFQDVDDDGKIMQIQDLPEHPSKWICGVHHGTLYKREIFEQYGIRFGQYYPDDVYINMMFNLHCKEVRFIHKVVYNWFIHKDSTSATKDNSDWMGINTFGQILEYTTPILSMVSKNEQEEIRFMLMKLYCLNIFHSYRYTKIKKTIKNYHVLKKMFSDAVPKYRKNKYLRFFRKSPMRKYATKICRFTSLLEKLHLMWLALICFHFISKIHYFKM